MLAVLCFGLRLWAPLRLAISYFSFAAMLAIERILFDKEVGAGGQVHVWRSCIPFS